MDPWLIGYFLGGIFAVFLCWDLGLLYSIPIVLGMVLELLLGSGLLSGVDFRQFTATFGFLYALWVMVLSDVFKDRLEGIVIFTLITLSFFFGIYPSLVEATGSAERSLELATGILKTWMLVIVGVVLAVVVRSAFSKKGRSGLGDLLVNPRKRFLIPLGVWAAIIAIPLEWLPRIGEWMEVNRFHIAGNCLVWGWVFIELKFYLQARYWRRRYG